MNRVSPLTMLIKYAKFDFGTELQFVHTDLDWELQRSLTRRVVLVIEDQTGRQKYIFLNTE